MSGSFQMQPVLMELKSFTLNKSYGKLMCELLQEPLDVFVFCFAIKWQQIYGNPVGCSRQDLFRGGLLLPTSP